MNGALRKNPESSIFKLFIVLFFVAAVTSPSFAEGSQRLSPEVHEALRAMASGKATTQQEALLFANNDAINRARIAEQIPDAQYQSAQRRFKEMNYEFAENAARSVGAEFEVQKSKAIRSQPGTDSDYITKVESSQQIADMQSNYNQQVNDYLQQNNVTSVDRADWHHKLDTDFMADPKGVSQAEFERIAEINNDAYKRRAAAEWEYKSRNPEAGPISQHETKEYVKEMEDFRNKKNSQIEEIQGHGDIESGSLDEGKLTQKQAQQQKYDSRIGEADARYRSDHGLPDADNPTHSLAKDGAIREPDITPEKAREILGKGPKERLTEADMQAAQESFDARRQAALATEENIHRNATRNAAEGFMEKADLDAEVDEWMRQKELTPADAPRGYSKNAARDAAEIMENMPPAEKARFMAEVESKLPTDPNTGMLTPESQRIMNDLKAEMRKRPGKSPGTKKMPDADTAKVSEPDSPKVNDPDGPKVADLDDPKVGDMDGPKAGDVDGAETRGGGVLEKVGEVMTASDILNTGQDVVDYMEGKKSAAEVAENAAVNFTPAGQIYSVAKQLDKKSSDYGDAQISADEVNRAQQQAHATTAGLEARKQGATKEEAHAIMVALRSGYPEWAEQMAQDLRDRGLDFHIPEAPEEYTVEADDGYVDRIGQVATGIGSQLYRAGNFVLDTAKNVHEIDTATDSILKDNMHVAVSEMTHEQQAQDLYDRLVAKGADPQEALEAATQFKEGNLRPLSDLRKALQDHEQPEKATDDTVSHDAMLAAAGPSQGIWDRQNGDESKTHFGLQETGHEQLDSEAPGKWQDEVSDGFLTPDDPSVLKEARLYEEYMKEHLVPEWEKDIREREHKAEQVRKKMLEEMSPVINTLIETGVTTVKGITRSGKSSYPGQSGDPLRGVPYSKESHYESLEGEEKGGSVYSVVKCVKKKGPHMESDAILYQISGPGIVRLTGYDECTQVWGPDRLENCMSKLSDLQSAERDISEREKQQDSLTLEDGLMGIETGDTTVKGEDEINDYWPAGKD